jgi:hypothetical protein
MDGNLEYLEGRINLLGTGGAGGTAGTSGTSGTSGRAGTSGTSGLAGTSGTSGRAGTSGTSGTSTDFSNYTGNVSITGDITLTGTLNDVPVSRGGGNSGENIAIGYQSLQANAWTSGDAGNFNVAVGASALSSNETGLGNTAVGSGTLAFGMGSENSGFGFQAMFFDTLGYYNTAIGSRALHTLGNSQTEAQSGNTAVGADAGRWLVPGTSVVSQATDSIFIGYKARPRSNAQINQIVIGADAVGNGDNTATLGNARTETVYLGGLSGEGIVLTSPNGTKYRITVADDGELTTTAI